MSTIIGSVTGLSLCGLISTLIAMISSIDPSALTAESEYTDAVMIFVMLAACVTLSPPVTLVGLIAGILGLRRRDADSKTAIIGIVLNGLTFLVTGGCLVAAILLYFTQT
jgi:hypothetical protein